MNSNMLDFWYIFHDPNHYFTFTGLKSSKVLMTWVYENFQILSKYTFNIKQS